MTSITITAQNLRGRLDVGAIGLWLLLFPQPKALVISGTNWVEVRGDRLRDAAYWLVKGLEHAVVGHVHLTVLDSSFAERARG